MRTTTIIADVETIGIASNGDIMCGVKVTYSRAWQPKKRATAIHTFNLTELIKEWEK